MTLHQRDGHLDTDEETTLLTRRAVLRRSALGIAGLGIAPLLTACDDDETEGPTGIEDIDEAPLDEDPAPGADLSDEDEIGN